MEFRYFKGPPQDMSQLLDGAHTCSICGSKGRVCFSLDYAMTDAFPDDAKDGKTGCVKCLQEGKFEFWHDTEFGALAEKGLTNVYNDKIVSLGVGFNELHGIGTYRCCVLAAFRR